ncbi:MAG: sulfurtransferase [Gammaproteobacteria bacterium]|nr:MAG: sulfurtransferase [Gammaproteobacteria bacterium]
MHYGTIITARDLLRPGPSPDWVVIDCRFELADPAWGESAYRLGHIPGAFFAHLDKHLCGAVTRGSGRHPLPDWRRFAERLGQWGIRPATQVVVYDQHNGAYAARLWWMLRALGHENAAVLDGGWSAWLRAGGAEDAPVPPLRSGRYEARCGSGWVTAARLEQELASGDCVLVDARSAERYRGEQEPIDPVAGHVPGALNRPYTENLKRNETFRSATVLRAQWTALLGGRAPGSVVHMCGSGVTACHNLLAMEIAGLSGSRLYAGSWSEWIADSARPVAVCAR